MRVRLRRERWEALGQVFPPDATFEAETTQGEGGHIWPYPPNGDRSPCS